jgi:hypothetical protein
LKITFSAAGKQVISVAIATTAIETALLTGVLRHQISPLSGGLAHVALSIGILLWAFRASVFADERVWPMLLAATVPVLGPMGSAGTLASMALTKFYRRSATSFDDWHASIFFPEETRLSIAQSMQAEADVVPLQSGVSPFADILGFGTVEQKQQLISLITKEFRPEFAPALRMALRDSNTAIRVQAASAVTRIENDFTATTLKLSKHTGEPAPHQLLALAAHYAAYAATGFLDSERERACRQSALDAYQSYLRVNPSDSEAAKAYGKLLLELGHLNEAQSWFSSCIHSGITSPEASLLYMDVLFRLGSYAELRAVAANHQTDCEDTDDSLNEAASAVKLWASAPC